MRQINSKRPRPSVYVFKALGDITYKKYVNKERLRRINSEKEAERILREIGVTT